MVCSSARWYLSSTSPKSHSSLTSGVTFGLEPAISKQSPTRIPSSTSSLHSMPYDYLIDWLSTSSDPRSLPHPTRRSSPTRDILTELADLQRASSPTTTSTCSTVSSQSRAAIAHAVVHAKPSKDAHYPFSLARKQRTRPHSGVCVWCVARALLARPGCPVLHVRASGHDADWERWLRDMRVAGLWDVLVRSVGPLAALAAVDPRFDLPQFCRDLSGAILECVLRHLRGNAVKHRDLMAQVRSAKYHKVPRVAATIEAAYEQSTR